MLRERPILAEQELRACIHFPRAQSQPGCEVEVQIPSRPQPLGRSRVFGLDEDLDSVVRESVLDGVKHDDGFGFACWFRSDELAVGIEEEMMKRARC